MNFRQIEILLERYFNGETSLDEENTLRSFFHKDNIPPHLASLKPQFEFFEEASKENELDEEFDKKVVQLIKEEEKTQKRFIRKRNIYTFSGIAASILIIISFVVKFDPFTTKLQNTIEDPEIALKETKKALLFVSQLFNKGVKPAEKLASYNDAVKQINKVQAFSTGIEETSKIASFYNAQKKLINN